LHMLTLVFYVSLGLFAGIGGLQFSDPGKYDIAQLIPNLLLIHAWGTSARGSFNYPSWSVSAEWFAYLLFPGFVALLSRRGVGTRTLATVVGIWAAAILLAPRIFGQQFTGLANDFGIYRIAPQFLLGVVLRVVLAQRVVTAKPASWFVIVAAVFFVADALGTAEIVLLGLIPIFVVLLAEMSRSPGFNPAFPQIARALEYLGEISFSMYMLHAPLATIYFQFLKSQHVVVGWGMALGGVLLLVPCSVFSFEYIERPAQALMKNFCGRLLGVGNARPI
jgi:peptidoglycan/LPS O-acetylase OafA/YrhL